MKNLATRIALIVFTLTSVVQIQAEDPLTDNSELKKIQGTWKMVSLEDKTKKWAKDELLVVKLVIKGEVMTTHLKDGGKVKSIIEIEPNGKADPRELDTYVLSGPVVRGIYKIEGDTLTICNPGIDSPRPKKFDVKETAGSGGITVYQRVK